MGLEPNHRLRRNIWMFLCIQGVLSENNNTSNETNFHFRLMGGANHCHGDLEMKRHDENWKPMDGKDWYRQMENRVCAELDCGSVVSGISKWKPTDVDCWWLKPGCNESSLSDCFRSRTHLSSFLELNCSDSVRLVHGSNVCSGRLEVRSTQSRSWFSVCEGHLDLGGAQVVCRELGCGAPGLLQGMEAPVVRGFHCEGHESALLDCRNSGSSGSSCSSGKVVNVTCTDPDDVRLVAGARRCNGIVEIKHNGQWGDMGYTHGPFDPWNLKAADFICRRLDCGSAVSVKRPNRYMFKWSISPYCILSTSTLMDCVKHPETSASALSFTCSDSVRLVNGSSRCSGRLEVRSNQSWSSVCEEDLDLNDAQVVCKELGCGAPLLLQGVLYGEGGAPVWTSELQCEGNESAVLDCGRSSSDGKNCSNGTAAGLTCREPFRVKLVGEQSRCAGGLKIQQQGKWRPAADYYDDWDLRTASAVCQHLDCGSAVSLNRTVHSKDRSVWLISAHCVNLTFGLMDCVGLDDKYRFPYGVDVVCSDLLLQPNISLSDGVFEVYQQGFQVLVGSDFTITCSVQPQYPGGFFQLISDTKKQLNLTLPAVNHSAHFLLSNMGRPHRGNYTCVYQVYVYNHTFSSRSPTLYLTIGDLVTNVIIRVVLIILALLIFDLSIFYFYKVSMRRIQMKADTTTMRVQE